MKKQSMTIGEFMNRDYDSDSLTVKVTRHYKNYKIVYRIGTITVLILLIGVADFSDLTYADSISSLDAKAKVIYGKLVKVGKWIIISKGGIDTIKSVADGDFPNAKKHAFSYLMIFLLLLGMPAAYEMIEDLFEDL